MFATPATMKPVRLWLMNWYELHQVEPGSVGTSTKLINKSLELEGGENGGKMGIPSVYVVWMKHLNLPKKHVKHFMLNIIYAKPSSYVNVCWFPLKKKVETGVKLTIVIRPLGLEPINFESLIAGREPKHQYFAAQKMLLTGFPKSNFHGNVNQPLLVLVTDFSTWLSVPILRFHPHAPISAQKTGISSHFFVSDPPSPSKRALMPKRNTSTEGRWNIRIPGYYGMSPAACRGTWSCLSCLHEPCWLQHGFLDGRWIQTWKSQTLALYSAQSRWSCCERKRLFSTKAN